MTSPRHEREVVRGRATQIADDVRARLRALGFTVREAASRALAAERHALEQALRR
jgi:hypothetical protein